MIIGALKNFVCEERGATAVEYGLICALLFTALAVSLPLVAQEVNTMFGTIGNAVHSVTSKN